MRTQEREAERKKYLPCTENHNTFTRLVRDWVWDYRKKQIFCCLNRQFLCFRLSFSSLLDVLMSREDRAQIVPDPRAPQTNRWSASVSSQYTGTSQVPFRPCEGIVPCTVKQLKEGTSSDGRFVYAICTPSHVTVVCKDYSQPSAGNDDPNVYR